MNIGGIEAEDKPYFWPNLMKKEWASPVERSLMHLPRMVDVTTQDSSKTGIKASDRSPRYWLVKFAPFRTPWTEIVKRGTFTLRGVRSPAARKHLSEMQRGDAVLFYHSQEELAVVGVMEVTREAYPDPTSSDPQWLTCDFAPVKTLAHPVSLEAIKPDSRLATLALVRQPRLAVMPVNEEQFVILTVERQQRPAT